MKQGLVLFFMVLSFAVRAQTISAEQYFQQAVFLFHQGDHRSSLKFFNKSLETKPANASAYYYMGYIYLYARKHSEAQKSFEAGLKYDPYSPQLLTGLAVIYNETGQHEKALKLMNKVTTKNPFFPEGFNQLGVTLHRMGNYDSAVVQFDKAIALDTAYSIAYNNRGSARFKKQLPPGIDTTRMQLAVSDFSKALQIDSNMLSALRNRAMAYAMLNETDAAFADFNKLLDKNPNDAEALFQRARLKYEQKDYKGAISDLINVKLIRPEFADTYTEMGKAKTRLGYYYESIEDHLSAIVYNGSRKGISFYYIAANCALLEDKRKMLHFLKLSEKEKFFSVSAHLEQFLSNPDFDNFKTDADFIAFKQKLK